MSGSFLERSDQPVSDEFNHQDGDLIYFNASHPFASIYQLPKSFYDPEETNFIPSVPVTAKFIDIIRESGGNYFSPYLYVIQVKHGSFCWQVRRRYRSLLFLHQQLRIAALHLTTKGFLDRKNSISGENKTLPKFPHKMERLLQEDELITWKDQLEAYVCSILQMPAFREHSAVLHFLEVSRLSFIKPLGHKSKEGYMRKRPSWDQRNYTNLTLSSCARLKCLFPWPSFNWVKRWFIIKDSFLVYLHPKDGKIRAVLLMDKEFKVTLVQENETVLRISNLSRILTIKSESKREAHEWFEVINNIAQTTGRDFTQSHRYNSFAPIRYSVPCQWFVDGADYFEAIADALEAAKEEIFVACWWFSPEIYLKRPIIHGDIWRLDKVLQRKASQGVRIFIMLYKEKELALGINSLYSKQHLMRLHPNIKVLRHPDVTPIFWSHHEKLIIVDQDVAFAGGMDLCYGRWDTFEHKLTDLAGLKFSKCPKRRDVRDGRKPSNENGIVENFQDANPHVDSTEDDQKDDNSDEKCNVSAIKQTDKQSEDIKPTTRLLSAHKLFKVVAKINQFRASHKRHGSLDSIDEVDFEKARNIPRRTPSELGLADVSGGTKLWIGKDYANFIIKDFTKLDQPYRELVDRRTTPRMPWHDVGLMVKGDAARDVARHFIDRWNFTKFEKAQYFDKYPWLLPRLTSDVRMDNVNQFNYKADCQIIRSVSDWSSGTRITESSILEAYIDIIDSANHYIYIENQFFITRSSHPKGRETAVINQVGEALYRRIIRAHRNNEDFRVYVLITLLPGFEGEIGTSTGVALEAVTHWNMVSISQGSNSLLSRLEREIGDTSKYINFYGLRNHGELNESLVNELIYVHSKLMIVDDLITLIGSANINDRSLSGFRDSEVCVVISDTETTNGIMNGKSYQSGMFSGSLRKFLFREHLGLLTVSDADSLSIDIRDPVSEKFYVHTWDKIAQNNTEIYEKVFGVYPSDEVKTFAKLRERQRILWLADTDEVAARAELSKLRGHLVKFPLQFLADERLQPSSGTKESLIPSSVWQ